MEEILSKAVDQIPGIVVFSVYAILMGRAFLSHLAKKDEQFTEALKIFGSDIIDRLEKIDGKLSEKENNKRRV